MVAVPVGRDHLLQAAVAEQPEQRGRVVGGVDQRALAGLAALQQVGVVVHRPDRHLGDPQAGQLTDVRSPAPGDVAGVGHGASCHPFG